MISKPKWCKADEGYKCPDCGSVFLHLTAKYEPCSNCEFEERRKPYAIPTETEIKNLLKHQPEADLTNEDVE